MIYTLTMNPSLDYYMWVDELQIGKTNRSDKENILLGGKGLNVAKTLSGLGIDSTAICVVAGFVGDEIEKRIKEQSYQSKIIRVDGNSRINIKIKSKLESEINATGPKLAEADLEEILNEFGNVKEEDIVILSGSLPKGVGKDFYAKIIECIKHTKVKVVVDASGEALKNAIVAGAFLVKPNLAELAELFGVEIVEAKTAEYYARMLLTMGAENVLVSMGEQGSIFINEKEMIYKEAIKGETVNTVGAGDAMVAGFVKGYLDGKRFEDAMELASVCATEICFGKSEKNFQNKEKSC